MLDHTGSTGKTGLTMPRMGAGPLPPSARIDGYMALEYLGRIMLYGPCVGLLFTQVWSVGIALIAVVAPLTWLGCGGQVPAWMMAKPEPAIDSSQAAAELSVGN